MWNKHSIWTQCSLTLPLVMTLASILSLQMLTLWTDLYWSVCLCVSTAIQFIAAEHGVFLVTQDEWQKINVHRTFIIRCIIASMSILQWETYYQALNIIPFAIVSLVVSKHHRIVLALAVLFQLCIGPGPWILTSIYWITERLADYYFANTIKTSIADVRIKKAYGYTAVSTFFEGLVLWHLRCQHRFPYTLRWTPIVFGSFATCLAFLWASQNIKDTHVSRNAIIKRRGHNIAASLTAASACEICRGSLTSLDMESSFGD